MTQDDFITQQNILERYKARKNELEAYKTTLSALQSTGYVDLRIYGDTGQAIIGFRATHAEWIRPLLIDGLQKLIVNLENEMASM